MKYQQVVEGTFLHRPNRFIAHVLVQGKEEIVHVKNTGRCKELLIPGVKIALEVVDHPNRKTKMDLICVYKEGIGWINMDSLAPNQVVKEWLLQREDVTYVKPETTYGDSRFDFFFRIGEQECFMEVKGVTLEREKIGYFPDAPTQRGVKHMKELIKAKQEGYRCFLAFVVQMEGVYQVEANLETHPEFAYALDEAKKTGVEVLVLPCKVTPDTLTLSS